jgi:putative nucleotidyltransferase with HDIG domain
MFNLAAPALAMWAASNVFFLTVRLSPPLVPAAPLSSLFIPLVLFASLYFFLNTALIAAAIGLDGRTSPIAVWRCHFVPLWLTYFGGTAVAALLLVLVRSRGADPVVLALVAPIPLILYATFKSTIGRIEDHVAHFAHVNQMYLATIETLAHAIDAKDQVTHGHIRRVQQHAMRLAAAMNINDDAQLRAIEAAALLHDMGKLAVPEHILNKPGRLTSEEFEKMKRHAAVGADILSSIDFPYPVVPIVRHHHENWDGSGYPNGLKGTAIPIGARILSVVDCFDALTSDRPYRRRLSAAEAVNILRERRGTMYDPDVVDRFVEMDLDIGTKPAATSAADALCAIAETVQARDRSRHETVSSEPALLGELVDLGTEIAGLTDGTALASRVLNTMERLTPATCCAIYLYDSRADALAATAVAGEHSEAIEGLTIAQGQRLTGWVAAHRATIVNSDAALDLGNLAMRLQPSPHSCVSTALVRDKELVGAITLYSTRPAPFTDRDAAILEVLAPRIAASLSRRSVVSRVGTDRRVSRAGTDPGVRPLVRRDVA